MPAFISRSAACRETRVPGETAALKETAGVSPPTALTAMPVQRSEEICCKQVGPAHAGGKARQLPRAAGFTGAADPASKERVSCCCRDGSNACGVLLGSWVCLLLGSTPHATSTAVSWQIGGTAGLSPPGRKWGGSAVQVLLGSAGVIQGGPLTPHCNGP